ncbi:unnamed protein product [Caenorhabditis angaria]|uniref:Uncharacterized protein n=1 Tax=Caenorhabditis angaria TaxID=860376 RepID=A0A9P1MXF7_9PELO|nr:unnamed protein product [Caenorhabditis angaria]
MSSNHHSNCTLGASGALKRCDCGEDGCDSEKLWNDFESCAQSVAKLYRDSSWRSFRGAAEGTTQLYKTSVDGYRRGYDKGFQSGRSSLAKEILAAFSSASKFDLNIVLEVLYRNMRMSTEENGDNSQQLAISQETLEAMQLFQQALTQPPVSNNVNSSPMRNNNQANPELNTFFMSQVQRHRKRQRSPTSNSSQSPNSQSKRQRK